MESDTYVFECKKLTSGFLIYQIPNFLIDVSVGIGTNYR